MRDILLSGTAGFFSSCAAAFAVHRALWKAAEDQSQQLDELAGRSQAHSVIAPKRRLADSFEGFIFRRFSQWWNSSVDNVHGRLLGLPDTVNGIVQDAKSGNESPPVSK